MIAVDTSALVAVVLKEAEAELCVAALQREDMVLISAATLAELLIVSARRRIAADMLRLIDGISPRIVSVTPVVARQVGAAYERWGRGMHPAALNFGDCFAYALAKEHGCPLLYVGNDFAQTDIESVL